VSRTGGASATPPRGGEAAGGSVLHPRSPRRPWAPKAELRSGRGENGGDGGVGCRSSRSSSLQRRCSGEGEGTRGREEEDERMRRRRMAAAPGEGGAFRDAGPAGGAVADAAGVAQLPFTGKR